MKRYVIYANRDGARYQSLEYETRFFRFLYHTFIGRLFLKFFKSKFVAKSTHWYKNSRFSKKKIKKLINNYDIDMTKFENEDASSYKSFAQFFERKLKVLTYDTNELDFISPCDSKLLALEIKNDSIFNIKKSEYNIETILKDKDLAEQYKGGYILIFRLSENDYHHYIYTDSGTLGKTKHIDGCLHTTQPIAIHSRKVYHENTREYITLNTDHFGEIIYMEIGAMCIGRIINYYENNTFNRGEYKGKFEFGGSTIAIFVKKDSVIIDEDILKNSLDGIETVVSIGSKIGIKKQD